MFLKDIGQGFPIVLLHGFCESHKIWTEVASELAHEFRIIMPDLPGFGHSALLEQFLSIERISDLVSAQLVKSNIHKPIVIGHSLGGYVALAMAKRQPSSISGLGLFHSTPLEDTEEKKNNRNKTIDFVKNNGVIPFVKVFIPSLFYQKENPAVHFVTTMAMNTPIETIINYSLAMRDRPSSGSFLTSYTSPVMIVAGVNDLLVPVSVLREVSSLRSPTHFFELKNTGHMGMFEDLLGTIKCFRAFAKSCQIEKG
jgi:pimeloyl-ACP methyl ester carboxylesterase